MFAKVALLNQSASSGRGSAALDTG